MEDLTVVQIDKERKEDADLQNLAGKASPEAQKTAADLALSIGVKVFHRGNVRLTGIGTNKGESNDENGLCFELVHQMLDGRKLTVRYIGLDPNYIRDSELAIRLSNGDSTIETVEYNCSGIPERTVGLNGSSYFELLRAVDEFIDRFPVAKREDQDYINPLLSDLA